MGNDQEGARVIDECFLQDVLRLHVKMVGGFVENEEVGRSDEHANEGDARSFSSGKDANFLKDVIAFEKEAAEDITRGHGGSAGLDFFNGF